MMQFNLKFIISEDLEKVSVKKWLVFKEKKMLHATTNNK